MRAAPAARPYHSPTPDAFRAAAGRKDILATHGEEQPPNGSKTCVTLFLHGKGIVRSRKRRAAAVNTTHVHPL